MKQKFKMFSFVKVCKKEDLPIYMSHFDWGFDAIVAGSYSQLFGGKNVYSYSLHKIKEGKIVDTISWYEEGQLTLLDENNRDKAEEMVEEWNFINGSDDDDDM